MAVTRINTNQINDAQVTAAKIAPYTLTGGLFSNTITLNSNINVIGNLDVQGNTTTVNSVNTYVNDPIITFNNGYVGAPSYDIGMLVNRNLGPLTGYGNYNTAWIWDENSAAFAGVVTTEVGNSPGGTINKSYYANLKVGNIAVINSLTTTTLTVGAGIQNTPIGNATPSTGAFTTGYFGNLSTGNIWISGGNISALANAYITDFSTGNAVLTGGYISAMTNITATTGNVDSWYAANLNSTTANITTGNIVTLNVTDGNITTLVATNLSSGNVAITGGYINSVANVNATDGNITTLVATNFSSGNVKITGGYIDAVANVYAGTAQFTNLSTGNAVITGGYIDSVTNVYATTGTFTNLSSGNAVITGGYINSVANVNATDGNITTLVATNLSSGNAAITGGYINSVANVNATDGNITTLVADNFSSANAAITGGYINSVANVNATDGNITTLVADNFSSANVFISGGYIDSVSNVYATDAGFTNLSTGNAVITGGYIDSVANVYATDAGFTNLSTGNAVITGGYIDSVANVYADMAQFTDLSTGNAVISGGYISAMSNITATTGNVDSWYAGTINATTGNITTGNINNFSTANAVISGGYADNFAIGANTAAPASFTTANTTANLGVGGNAIVTNTLYAANIVTTGTSGNISGVDYLLTANIIATSNAQASWFLGNVKGDTGNLTTLNANLVTANYFKSDNYQYANGEPFISTTIANTAEITANVSGGQNIGLELTTTGVTAGDYGSGSSIPTITVDNKGRVTSITTNAAATGFDLAADTGTGSVSAGQILTLTGTANEIETSVSGNAFTIGLPNDVNISTLYATNLSTGNAIISGGYADSFPVGANTAASGAFTTLTAGNVTITDSTDANDSDSGALVVTGGVGIGGNVFMHKNLTVEGNLYVRGNTTTLGTQDLTVQDSIINLHTFANLDPLGANDGRDIGIAFHYYKDVDTHAFLGLVNDTNLLEFFDTGYETSGNVFVGNTYGGFKTGTIIVANTTQATAANTGAFQVYGGGSIIGNLYVGNIFAHGGNIGILSNVTSRIMLTDYLGASDIEAGNLVTGNAVISGGYIDSVANVYADMASFTDFSTGNAVITGGYIDSVANVYADMASFTDFSTGNAVITGGYINSVTNVYATTAQFTNLSTGNAVITGGYINSVANVYATDASFTNLSTGNAVISGGYISAMTNITATTGNVDSWYAGTINATNGNITTLSTTNLSTGNAVISGGYISAMTNITATTGNVDSWYAYELNTTNANIAGTLYVANFSTGNAVISGGYIDSMSNVYATTAGFTNLSTGNAVITGGYINAVANVNATEGNITTLVADNFSSGNAAITGGYIDSVANVYAGTAQFGNLSTGNAVITGGYIDSVANVYAGTAQFGNLSTGNAVITGGYIDSVANVYAGTAQFGNLSTGNAVITGGYINAVANINATDGNITTLVATNFSSGNAAITGGYINAVANVNATAGNITTLVATNFSSGNARISGGYADNFPIGANTAATGKFTTLNATANVYLAPTDGVATVTINPLNISNMDNMTIGASYSANAYVTNFKSTTSIEAGTSGRIWLNAGTLSGSGINNIPIGALTPATAVFTNANANNLTSTVINATDGNVAGTLYANNISSSNVVVAGPITATGNIVAGATTTSTSTTTGALVVVGGAGIAGNINAGGTIVSTAAGSAVSGQSQLYLNGATSNRIDWAGVGTGAPAFTTRSAGTKVVLYPSISGSNTDYALGIDAATMWSSVPEFGDSFKFKWYGATTEIASLSGTGNLKVAGNIVANSGISSTSTTTGALVLNGGAGISGNLNLGGNLVIGGNINSASNIVVNSNKSVNTDFAVRGKNEDSLIYAISNSVFDQVVIGGNITTATATQGAKLTISSTDSLLVPVGTTSDRPSGQGFTDVAGMLRFNSTTNQLEYYDSTQWIAPSTVLTIITSTQYALASGNPAGNVDGTNTDFTLPSAATTNSVIVSINGILQLPTVAYSVINSGLTLRFTEAPAIDDVVDVRILTTTSSISQLQSPNGLNVINIDNGNITFSTGNVSTGSVDQWHIDINGDFIPQTTANIGNAGHRVDYLFASNIDINGGALSGVSIAGTSFDGIPIGGNIASSGAFTSLYATTFANVPTLNVNNSVTIGSSLSLGSALYVDDSTGYSVLDTTTGMIGSFDKTVYRSGKYFVQLTKSDNSEFQAAEIIVVHNGTTPTIEVYGVTYTGASALGSFTANIAGNDVNINATALAGDVNAKVHPILMKL